MRLSRCHFGLAECHRSLSKQAFVKAPQYLLPEMTVDIYSLVSRAIEPKLVTVKAFCELTMMYALAVNGFCL